MGGGGETKQTTKTPLNQTTTKPRVFSLRFVIPAQCMEMAPHLWVISPCACSFRTAAALGFQTKMWCICVGVAFLRREPESTWTSQCCITTDTPGPRKMPGNRRNRKSPGSGWGLGRAGCLQCCLGQLGWEYVPVSVSIPTALLPKQRLMSSVCVASLPPDNTQQIHSKVYRWCGKW